MSGHLARMRLLKGPRTFLVFNQETTSSGRVEDYRGTGHIAKTKVVSYLRGLSWNGVDFLGEVSRKENLLYTV